MNSAWQIALMGVVAVFSLGSVAAQEESLTLVPPSAESTLLAPLSESQSQLTRPWSGEWWLASAAQSFSEGKDEGAGTGFRAGALLRYQLSPWARFLFDGEARFFSSRVQTRYDDDVMSSGLKLREGYAAFGQESGFEVKLGALGQRLIKSDLLIASRRAFPGVYEGMVFADASSNMRLHIWAQQTVPTSYSLNTKRSDREPTPTFLTETINLKITPAKVVEAEFYATHYRFNYLPAVVAFESSSLGNTVNGEVAPNSDFKYGFDGFLLGTEGCLCLEGPLKLRAGGQWLQNNEAPSRANRGQLLFLGTDLMLNSEINIKPRYSVFFNESDTSPAYYNSWTMGNNNRKGMIAQVEVEFLKYGFSLNLEYVQSAMINPDPFQFDKEVFSIGVETNHVPF